MMSALEPFKFVEIGKIAHNVKELTEVCRSFPSESANYLDRGDFEKWLFYIGEVNTAHKAVQARNLSVSSEEKLEKFLESYSETESISTPVSSPVETSTPASSPVETSTSVSSPVETPTPASSPVETPTSKSTSSESSSIIPQWLKNLFNFGKKSSKKD